LLLPLLCVADTFEAQASEAVMLSTAGTFPVDLGVTLLDSTGLLALLKVLQLPCGKDLIVQPSPQVFTLLRLANLVDGTLPSLEVRPPGGSPPP
jgi:hypothetical protein